MTHQRSGSQTAAAHRSSTRRLSSNADAGRQAGRQTGTHLKPMRSLKMSYVYRCTSSCSRYSTTKKATQMA